MARATLRMGKANAWSSDGETVYRPEQAIGSGFFTRPLSPATLPTLTHHLCSSSIGQLTAINPLDYVSRFSFFHGQGCHPSTLT